MDGPHDVGGRDGFGPVERSRDDEPMFRADWEACVFGLMLECEARGLWSVDHSRRACERFHPVRYLELSYFARWSHALEGLLNQHVPEPFRRQNDRETNAPGRAGHDLRCSRADSRLPADGVQAAKSVTFDRAPAFSCGEHVLTRQTPSRDHTRLPAYARGKVAEVVARHGLHRLPDHSAIARSGDARLEHVYTLAFDGGVLWGESGETGTRVMVDAWESYLNPVP